MSVTASTVTDDSGRVFRSVVYRRFSDLDPLGHVNNVVFYDYIQEARVHALRELGWLPTKDFFHVVVRQGLSFRKPLTLSPEPVVVETSVVHVGASAYTFAYRILDEHGDLAADGDTVLAVVDITTGRAVRMPDELRSALLAVKIDG